MNPVFNWFTCCLTYCRMARVIDYFGNYLGADGKYLKKDNAAQSRSGLYTRAILVSKNISLALYCKSLQTAILN